MPRSEFSRLLRKIGKQILTNFALPFHADQPHEYVRVVRTNLVEGVDEYHVLFYIPLLHTTRTFNVYRFFPYQVPLHDHNMSLNYFPSEPKYLLDV